MTNPFPYSNTNKRYHTWDYHLKETFGEKVFKVSIDGGFSCPNIDGTRGRGGCTYCSYAFARQTPQDLLTQFEEGKAMLHKKWPAQKYIPYFQANTNTYAPLAELKEKYEILLSQPGVVGLSIATRADALPEDVLDYLEELSHRTYLVVELGLQSAKDETPASILSMVCPGRPGRTCWKRCGRWRPSSPTASKSTCSTSSGAPKWQRNMPGKNSRP